VIVQKLLRSIVLGVQSLRLHKLRSLLTVLGVVFGVASVIVMLAVGEGARQEAIQVINELGSTNIILRSVKPAGIGSDGESTGAIRYGLTLDDLSRIQGTIPSIRSIAPVRDHRRRVAWRDRRDEGRVVGVTPEYQDINDIALGEGRFIESLDCQLGSTVVVLGAEIARRLFPLVNPLGQSIRIDEHQYYRVIGVARSRAASAGLGSSLPAQDFNRDVYIPFSTDQKRFGENVVFDRASSQPPEKVEISQLTLAVYRTEEVKPTSRIVDEIIRDNHRQNDTSMTVPLDLLEKAERTQRIFTWVLTAIASISLLVGGIGIMNIMLATVTERTREIGIRRALGARRSDITWQFLIETIVLSGTGGLIGISLGIAGSFLASGGAGVPTDIQPWSPVLAFVISVGVGLIFGVFPARRAANMDPIEALRHE
jgi:putative ABC transport system permease protein